MITMGRRLAPCAGALGKLEREGVGVSGEGFTVNSKQTLDFAIKWITDNFEKHKYSTYSVRHGESRSLNQNALFHVWCTEYAAFALKKHKTEVSEGEREGVKRYFKRVAYNENAWPWLIVELLNIETGQKKKDFRSSGSYKAPEMFQFLTWIQAYCMDRGCLLESKGEFKHKQQQQNN